MGYNGPGPIAGWGVRWNIDLAMYSHLVAARDVSFSFTFPVQKILTTDAQLTEISRWWILFLSVTVKLDTMKAS